ncbi:MAG: 16S rRNA (guanine(527)-N(7))-methyltransferase RsmG [Lentisphaeraceae bacterium]|nr:16S rRNA (guanine(527)-N(7))-methyltransferase RsmG [Lentisphaeraceae bacterium]
MFKEDYEKFRGLIERSVPHLNEAEFLEILDLLYVKHKAINDIHNLTRITSPADFFEKHVVDSLLIGIIAPELMTGTYKIADVGCGGGFPCLPLAMVNPNLDIHGVESLNKKVTAVNEVAKSCGLTNLFVHKARAREFSRLPEFNKSFDVVTARAVATADILIRECRQMLKPDGRLLFYKTPEAIEKEMKLTVRDSKKHNLKLELSEIIHLSKESGDRQFYMLSHES